MTTIPSRSKAELMLRAVAKQHADAGNAWQAASIVAAVDALASQAPAIDLEQFRVAVEAYEFEGECKRLEYCFGPDADKRAAEAQMADAKRLLALIDGQASDLVQACQRDQSPAPDRIWLQLDPDESPDALMPSSWDYVAEVTWCSDSTGGLEVEYVRADLAHVQPNKGKGGKA